MLTGCFTGVESTPRITARDVKRQHASVTPEMSYTASLAGEAPALWQPGKRFYVTSPRISYAMTPVDLAEQLREGSMLTYAGRRATPSMTEVDDTDLMFITAAGDTLHHRVTAPPAEIDTKESLEVPFTIEMSLVDAAAQLLEGNDYYITTPVWFNAAGDNIAGRQLVKVHIDSVTPGNTNYPLAVHFTDGRGIASSVFMSVGSGPRSTRNFDTLFTLTDPRTKYKDITDDIWDCITRCTVRKDMTREECRLAVGNPREVFYGHYIERWNYDNGCYLIFDDDHLQQFRF